MARKAGSDSGADANPEPRKGRSEDAQPAGLPDGLEPGEPSRPEDSASLRVETLSKGTQVAPVGTSPVEDAEVLRPDEPADALVAGESDLTEEAPPDRYQESEAPRVDEGPTAPGPAGMGASPADEDTFITRDDGMPTLATAEPNGSFRSSASDKRVDAATSPSPAPARQGGLGAMLLGGLIAAALGFGAAWLAQDRFGGVRLAADLEERLAALEGRPLPDGSQIEALGERVTEIEARLAALEEAPLPGAGGAPATSSVELEPLREEVTAGFAQVEERAADVEARLAALEAAPERPSEAALGSLATDPGPALRTSPAPRGPDAGAEAVAALEPRLAEVEVGLAEARETLSATGAALGALDERVASNEAILSDFDARLGESEERLDETDTRLGQSETRLDEAGARLREAETRLNTVDTRLDDVEATGAAAVEEARAAAGALAEARDRAATAEAEARREAAIAALDSALDAGEPFEAALPALGDEAPEALTRAASQGVASLATLRETFPEAARAGLAAARRAGLLEEGGVTGFLFGQLSVRSTAPREGDDVDAVLSRAEAALARGRLGAALAEVERLPEPVRAAMADWIAQARARVEAEDALQTLRSAEPSAAPAD